MIIKTILIGFEGAPVTKARNMIRNTTQKSN